MEKLRLPDYAMTVRDLKKALEDVPEDRPVLLKSDEEGNDTHFLYDVNIATHTLFGDGEISTYHPDDVGTEVDSESLELAVVLWP